MKVLAFFAAWASSGAIQRQADEAPGALVEGLLRGDDGALARLRSLGPGVFQALQPFRRERRVRDLIRSIRESAASAEDRTLATRLSSLKTTFDGGQTTFGEAVEALMGDGIRCAIDPRELGVIAACQVTLPREGTSLDALEEISAQAGTDFAFLYGIVMIARPDRLWPALPPRVRPLTVPETAFAKGLVARLGAETPEERDRAAAELRRFGPPVVAELEAGSAHRDAEVAGRCRGLIEELRARPARVFGPSAAERQALAGPDAAVLSSLKGKWTSYKVNGLLLRTNLRLLLGQMGPGRTLGPVPDVKLSFSFEEVPSTAILAVVTQSVGLDYLIEDGQVVIGPEEEILARLKR